MTTPARPGGIGGDDRAAVAACAWNRADLTREAIDALTVEHHPNGRFLNGRVVGVLRSPHIDNAEHVAVGFSALPPGHSSESHHHVAEEIAYVLAGSGYVEIDGIRYPIEPGSLVFTPSEAPHRTASTGNDPLVIAWVYSPAGSETRWLTQTDESTEEETT